MLPLLLRRDHDSLSIYQEGIKNLTSYFLYINMIYIMLMWLTNLSEEVNYA